MQHNNLTPLLPADQASNEWQEWTRGAFEEEEEEEEKIAASRSVEEEGFV